MNRPSHKPQLGGKWASFGFAALTVFLLAISTLPAAAQKAGLAGWRFEIEEGQKLPSTLGIHNICRGPHRFRIKSNIKYLSFGEPTAGVLVAPASTREVKLVFDAVGLKSKLYQDKVIVECLDCKKEKGCHQDRQDLPVEMTVAKAAFTKPASLLHCVPLASSR